MKVNRIIIVTIILLSISLACNLPAGAKPTAIPAAPVDPGQILDQAVQVDPASKSVTVTLTEEQMNGLMLSQIQKMDMPSGATLSEPSVKLRDGKITFLGKIENGLLTFDVSLSLKPVNNNGVWTFEVAEADFGPLPVPDSITSQFAEEINSAVDGSLQESGQVTIDNIIISDGVMVITAHR